MKLKENYITQMIEDVQFMVPVGIKGFSGIVRSNETSAFIVDCLKEETTEEAIVDRMCAEYDAPRNVIAADVKEILATLREIRAIEG